MIIFLYGADTYRSRRMLQEMKKKFIKDTDPDSQSLNLVDGQVANLKEITEKINTGSLFVKKRLIIIDNIFKNKKEKIFGELAAYLKKFSSSEETIIIFIDEDLDGKNKSLKADAKKLFAFLGKQKYVQEFKLLSGLQLLNFIKKETQGYKKEISTSAASTLINLTGGDLWQMSSEIKKLSFYTADKIISENEVKEMVAGSFNEDIFALSDALSTRNKALALKLLEEQYAAGLSEEYLIVMLIRQFKILLQIREALDNKISPNDLASQLKIHPFVAKKGALQAKNFNVINLKNYLNRLINLDFLNKNSQTDIKTELTLLISSL